MSSPTSSLFDTDRAPEAIRGEVRLAGFRRVAHGLFLPQVDGLSAQVELERDLRAWLLVLPEGAVFTHLTAARVLGWQVPVVPEQVPVFAAVEGDGPRPRRPGLICSRLVRPTVPFRSDPVPVDQPEEILLRAARDLGVLDLTVMVDSALRLGHLDGDRLKGVLASGRPGVRLLRLAWEASDARAESGGESVLRAFHDAIGVPVVPQVVITDDDGRFVCRADLLVLGTPFLHEYDGLGHRRSRQHVLDLRRERRLGATPHVRRGYTLSDLLHHPLVLIHEIDRALGRPHRPRRLERWRALVDQSLYSSTGRERIMNRWHRQMGVVQWSRTA